MSDIKLEIMTRNLCHDLYKNWENDISIYGDEKFFKEYIYDKSNVDSYFDSRQVDDRIMLAIIKDNKIVGELQLKNINKKEKSCVMSIHLQNDSYKNQGIGRKAEKLAIKYAFEVLNFKIIFADTILKNIRSQRALEKAGFKFMKEDNEFRYYELKNNYK